MEDEEIICIEEFIPTVYNEILPQIGNSYTIRGKKIIGNTICYLLKEITNELHPYDTDGIIEYREAYFACTGFVKMNEIDMSEIDQILCKKPFEI